MTILIFLRSDIFAVVQQREKEPDKLQYEVIFWRNIETLLKIIEKRIAYSLDERVANWAELLESSFHPSEMMKLLGRNILLRPRDIIYYFQRILYYARLRSAIRLSKDDFSNAMTDYSEYALLALSAESQPYIPDMFDLILSFSERKAVLSEDEVNGILLDAGVENRELRRAVDFLVESNFLGYGIDRINYVFPTSPREAEISYRRALNSATRHNRPMMFQIHRAFHPSLLLS